MFIAMWVSIAANCFGNKRIENDDTLEKWSLLSPYLCKIKTFFEMFLGQLSHYENECLKFLT